MARGNPTAACTSLLVNGGRHDVSADPERSLLHVLREELDLTGAKYGCAEGECGVCTVLVDGDPVRACVTPVGSVVGRAVTTIEGVAADGRLSPVQQAFVEVGAWQCGYCTPGMVLSTTALLHAHPEPDEAQIRECLAGNICRCCTYPRILEAVRRASVLTARSDVALPAVAAAAGDARTRAPLDGPWDLLEPGRPDWFGALDDGLLVVLPPEEALGPARAGIDPPDGTAAWIHVGADGIVTAFTGKVEVGQDNSTALVLLVAEELRVELERVRLVMGDTDVCPFDMGTYGSLSLPQAGEALRATAACAREALAALGAQRADEYASVAAGLRRVHVASRDAPVTPATAWRVAGRPTRRSALAEVVTGERRYGTDLSLPGMLHGRVLRPPSFGATLRSLDAAEAESMPQVRVVRDGDFVGITAPDPLTAQRALDALVAEWDAAPQPSEAELVEHLRSHPIEVEGFLGAVHHERGRVEQALEAAPTRLACTYTTAYIAHVPMEARVGLARWDGDRLTVWTGTQRPFGVRQELADHFGIDESRVRVLVPPTGGGFGGKHLGDAAIEAARLARGAAGRPVKVRWNREEEFSWAYFRPAAVIDVRSGAERDGTLTAWDFRNVNSGSAGLLSPYGAPDELVDFQPAASPLRQGSYRALAATANHFARESHLDELAHELGFDPLELRLRNLRDERLAAVLEAAAERAAWRERDCEDGRGSGLAVGLEKDSRVATIADLRVHDDGRVEVLRIVSAFDCGAIVNPDNLRNQIEGATIMGLGGALFEAIRFADGRILNPRLSAYRVPRLPDVPPIEIVLLDRRDVRPAGAGETPIVAVAPALANAVFAATGRRVRHLPLAPDGVLRRPEAAQLGATAGD